MPIAVYGNTKTCPSKVSCKIRVYNFCIQYMFYPSKSYKRDFKWWEIDFDLMHLSLRKISLNNINDINEFCS